MALVPMLASAVLLVCGVAFALFLGIASERIEAQRERDLEALQHPSAPHARRAA